MRLSETVRLDDLAAALLLLTRLPVPYRGPVRGAAAAWAWPFAGCLVAALGALLALFALAAGLTDALAAGVLLAVLTITTGGLHEDGLADVADGFWGGSARERRLEIMRDSRIGSYGVIALILSLGFRWIAYTTLIAAGAWGAIVAAAMLSRAAMPVVMRGLKPARDDGLSRHVGRPGLRAVALGLAIAVGAAIGLTGWAALVACVTMAIGTLGVVQLARHKIGGQTGDVLGAVQQVAEIVVLATFTALL